MILIIGAGIAATSHAPRPQALTSEGAFFFGILKGYQTMDLLAGFFFATFIMQHLHKKLSTSVPSERIRARYAMISMVLGIGILGVIYTCFVYLGAIYGPYLSAASPEQSLGVIARLTLGSLSASTICIAVVFACLTTAVALSRIATEFFHKKVAREKISLKKSSLLMLGLTFLFSLFKFDGIAAFLEPILEVLYPGLILLSILNIVSHYMGLRNIKVPVYFAFAIAGVYQVLF